MSWVLSKVAFEAWIRGLLKDRVVIAPKQVQNLLLFRPVATVDEIALDGINTTLSPKDCFFATTDSLFHLERKDSSIELIPNVIEKESILLGIRPCDARGLKIIDNPFLADPTDALYAQRRAKTTLVGLACKKACAECFCTSMGSAPNDSSDLDVLLIEVDGGYIVQAVTEKGRAILAEAKLSESEVSPPPAPAVAPVPTESIVEACRKAFNAEYWDRLADRCIHCNLCAYVCPTCYCFDVRDYSTKDKVERVRTWESCQSPGFTRIAGGYNPRATKGSRLRQRFCHKLLYFPEQFGVVKCVGCGRCVTACPVNIDIREIIQDLQKLGAQGVS